MPIVASNGAMRGEFCSGRKPKRSITIPSSAAADGHHKQASRGAGSADRVPQPSRHRRPTMIDRAVRKVDQPADAEDQRQPDRDERVDVAEDQAVDGVVEPGAKEFLMRGRHGASLRWPTISRLPSQPDCALPNDELAFMARLDPALVDIEGRAPKIDARHVLHLGERFLDRLPVGTDLAASPPPA